MRNSMRKISFNVYFQLILFAGIFDILIDCPCCFSTFFEKCLSSSKPWLNNQCRSKSLEKMNSFEIKSKQVNLTDVRFLFSGWKSCLHLIDWDNTSSWILCLRTTKTDPTFRKHRFSAFKISFSIKVDVHVFFLSIKHRQAIISFLSLLLFFSPSSLNVITPTSLFFFFELLSISF